MQSSILTLTSMSSGLLSFSSALGSPAIVEVGSCLSQLRIVIDTSKVCSLNVLQTVLHSVPASTGIN